MLFVISLYRPSSYRPIWANQSSRARRGFDTHLHGPRRPGAHNNMVQRPEVDSQKPDIGHYKSDASYGGAVHLQS